MPAACQVASKGGYSKCSLLVGNKWNQIEIYDLDSWTYNNIRIGIDKSFGTGSSVGDIDDFDTSFWYSGGAHVTPSNPTEIEGELMIKLELFEVQSNQKAFPSFSQNGYWHNYYPYDFVPIDFNDDKIKWNIELSTADINNYGYARLYIFGYSWIVEQIPETNDYFILEVNGNQYAFDPEDMWSVSRPIGHWNWITIPKYWLNSGQNTIWIWKVISDRDESHKRHNLAIILFTDVDNDQSAWYYYNGINYYGDYLYRPDYCQGELGMFLVIYKQKSQVERAKRVGGFEIGCDWDANPYTHGWSYLNHNCNNGYHLGSAIVDGNGFNGLEDYQWTDCLLRDYDCSQIPEICEGYLSSEKLLGKTSGDGVDLAIVNTHGLPWELLLCDNDFVEESPPPFYGWAETSGVTSTYDITMSAEGYPETDNWGGWINNDQRFWYGWSEDGFNNQADWIMFLSCFSLRGTVSTAVSTYAGLTDSTAMDQTTPFQYMLYHGAHILMGFATNLFAQTDAQLNDFANRLVNNLCVQNKKIIEAFMDAVDNCLPTKNTIPGNPPRDYPVNRYIIYYHVGNQNDRFNPKDYYDFDFLYGFEQHTLSVIKHPNLMNC